MASLGTLFIGLPVVFLGFRLVNFYKSLLESLSTNNLLDMIREASVLDLLLNIFLFFLALALASLYNLLATDLCGHLFLQRVYSFKTSFVKQLKNIAPYFLYLLLFFFALNIVGIVFVIVIFIFGGLSILFASLGLTGFSVVFSILSVLVNYAIYSALEVFVRMTIPSMVIERIGLFKAFGRSFSLAVKGYWQLAGITFLFNLILLVTSFVLILGILSLLAFLFSNFVSNPNRIIDLIILIVLILLFITWMLNQMLSNAFNVVLLFRQRLKYESLAAELLTEDLVSGEDKTILSKTVY